MVVVVLALAAAITGYVGWLMWNAPASPPLPPGKSELQVAGERLRGIVRARGSRRSRTARMRQWGHRSTA